MIRGSQVISEPCGLAAAQLARLADEEVMAHVQGGHDDALAVLFDRYHRLVISIAFRILRDQGEAEEVTQMVFLEIYRAAAQFDPSRGTCKAWLLQYAYHRSMNRRKYLNRRRFYEQLDEQGVASAAENVQAGTRCAPGGGQLVLQELRMLVHQGLGSLNREQCRALQMAYFEGMSLQEVADRTGESFGNVRHHYYRGLSRLRSFVLHGSAHGRAKDSAEVPERGSVQGAVDVEA